MSYVDFVEQFANALCLGDFSLSGNSNGAQCSIYYAVHHPERVKRMALIATGGIGNAAGVDTSQVRRGIQVPSFDGSEESMQAAVESIIYRKGAIDADLLTMRTKAANLQKDSMPAANNFNRKAAEDPNIKQLLNLKGRLDALTIPTIYLHGEDDVFAPVEGGYLAEPALRNIQFFYPEQCGHQGQTDQPELFNQVFLEFFRDGIVSRSTADKAGVSKRRPEIPTLVEQKAGVSV
jgi:2-hydroxy-6-oxonona-2,4-dienedioate hydrolase